MKPVSSARKVAAVVVVAILIAPSLLGTFGVSLLNEVGIAALVSLGLVLLGGVGGMTSFGQAAFVGIAAYSTAWLSKTQEMSPWIGLVFALAITAVVAVLIGALTLRLGGHFLSLSTIAWGISIPVVFGDIEALGRQAGLLDIPPIAIGQWSLADPRSIYWLIWLIFGLASWFCFNLLQSRPGRAIKGLRGGTVLLASVGADAFRVRMALFVIAALLAGIGGWLFAHMNRFVSPGAFDAKASIEYLLMAVSGGITSLFGAPIGSFVVITLKDILQDVLPLISQFGGQLTLVVFSAFFVLMLHFARSGIAGFIKRRWRGERVVPSDPVAADPLPRRPVVARGTRLLSVEAVCKRFGGLLAVNNVSFDVQAGEIVGLIGPNGAGKSTMFDLVTRTRRATSGTVRFADRDVTHLSQCEVARLGVGRTFQHFKLRPEMSLLDNVALGSYARSRSGYLSAGLKLNRVEERRILSDAVHQLERIGLHGQAHVEAGTQSLGTQRMVEIARALATDPALLVLDEPAAGLRLPEKQVLARLLRQLREEGLAILIVEHDMDFVMGLVDRLVVMNFGSKLAAGSPQEVRMNKDVQAAYLGGAV